MHHSSDRLPDSPHMQKGPVAVPVAADASEEGQDWAKRSSMFEGGAAVCRVPGDAVPDTASGTGEEELVSETPTDSLNNELYDLPD